jgi:molecular chaperone DnaK
MIELRNRAQGLVYSTERSLAEYGDFLKPAELEEIKYDLRTVKELLQDANKEELQAILQSLEASAYRLAEAMYSGIDTGDNE